MYVLFYILDLNTLRIFILQKKILLEMFKVQIIFNENILEILHICIEI